ncbi:MAG: response regulator [Hyphomicrobiaceae bacterium]
MQYGTEFSRELISLRRYARAISGSQEVGDDLVVATLEALMSSPLSVSNLTSRATIFQLLSRLWNTPAWSTRIANVTANANIPASTEDATAADKRLLELPSLDRQAFLLVAMEEFSEPEASQILDLAQAEFTALIQAARQDVAGQIASNVMIIEDELFIATELEDIVTQLGHHVVGIASTHSEAVAQMQTADAHLVLADVQLADGSSGIDAVDEILTSHTVPVIFITAFPERLLTGLKPEPTYLIKKPFRVQEVRAAVSQALFFMQRSATSQASTAEKVSEAV